MYIVADIGGTKTRIAGTRDLEHLLEPVILEALAIITATAKKVADGEPIDAFVAGLPGMFTKGNRVLWNTPHLPDWNGKNIAADLETALSSKVHLDNDAALVGLGEAVYGSGRGIPIVVYITVSTGVNGVRIIDGSIDRSTQGFEMGGQYLFVDKTPTSLENLISGTAIREKYGKHPKEIEKNSPIWEELALLTAYGVHNTILHWSPDIVVLGGSMFNEIGIPVDRVHAHVHEILKKFPSVPDIVHSALKDVGGLHGGLAHLKQLQ
ncbi:MAG: hypothetical protein UY70_C0020G0004 [Candidatus Kaiserbacteria bacterium GW2011_GWB1_52_6]|uniref:ROK family protein n=1 Tax=Candidatus Kaiserbacteria bacterium GW2011_GWB1_52_6 TaxID=1618674 RepID=A0A0G2A3C0_9BACT|nr:MAG: hypothetical protein UY70_C0020G0004 [Candidatus Kaiserbacteria bacterium GW2011_GWB1_52_6]